MQETALAAEEAALLQRIAEEDSLLASEEDGGIYEVLEDGTLRSLLTAEVAEARCVFASHRRLRTSCSNSR